MNAKISYLVSVIKRSIPPQVLEYVFRNPQTFNMLQPSIEHELRNRIIDGWVLRDCNVIGGIECWIDILGCQLKDYPGGVLVLIPNSQTGGKSITSVLSVSFSMGTYYTGNYGNEIVNGVVGPTAIGSARIHLVGPNTVYFEGGIISPMRYIRCLLENDTEFQNINDRSLAFLSKMCVLATKAYIYNETVIKAETMPIIQGLPMGKVADIIGEYSDSLEMYNELLTTKLRKTLILNDRNSHNRHIRMLLSK
jgi:hypothetical protein